jgi:hypothetical protein
MIKNSTLTFAPQFQSARMQQAKKNVSFQALNPANNNGLYGAASLVDILLNNRPLIYVKSGNNLLKIEVDKAHDNVRWEEPPANRVNITVYDANNHNNLVSGNFVYRGNENDWGMGTITRSSDDNKLKEALILMTGGFETVAKPDWVS